MVGRSTSRRPKKKGVESLLGGRKGKKCIEEVKKKGCSAILSEKDLALGQIILIRAT